MGQRPGVRGAQTPPDLVIHRACAGHHARERGSALAPYHRRVRPETRIVRSVCHRRMVAVRSLMAELALTRKLRSVSQGQIETPL